MPDVKATLEISRDSEKDIKIRGLEVFLDGKFLRNLSFGHSLELNVEPGEHVVKVTNSLYTRELSCDLQPGETAHLQVGNVMGKLGAIFIPLFGVGPYKVFIREVQAYEGP